MRGPDYDESIHNAENGIVINSTGGGASSDNNIINSTVDSSKIDNSIHFHVHIHGGDETLINKIARTFNGILGKRSALIENVTKLSSEDLQGRIGGIIEDRQHEQVVRESNK